MTVLDEKKSSTPNPNIVIEDKQLGVYRLLIGKNTGQSLRKRLDDAQTAIPLLQRLFLDIYHISPRLFIFFVLSRIWSGLEDALLMQLSSDMLRTIEISLLNGKPNIQGIVSSLIMRTLCATLIAYLAWWGEDLLRVLRNRIIAHFELYLMRANLRIDLPTALEASSKVNVSSYDAWSAFEDILNFLTELLTAVSQLAVISHVSRSSGGPVFVLLCIARPIFSTFFTRSLWDKVFYAYVTNAHHIRMKALEALAGGSYREDVISGDLSGWILKEYQKSCDNLGDESSDHPYTLYSKRKSPTFDMLCRILDDLPMVYCALNAIYNPSRFSIAGIAIMQSSSTTLRYSLATIFRSSEQFRQSVTSVKNIYATADIENKIVDGQISYPQPQEKVKNEGMSFELRNLSFDYPGSQKKTSALKDINLTIPAGKLVVVVGGNGSGKSTIVRILSRLYDPTSGDLLIDGHLAQDYKMWDLRQATSLLSQDNLMYPLSFAENIGLGCPELFENQSMIADAAEKGGATEFISKLEQGYDTVLDPQVWTVSHNLYGNSDHPLHEKMTTLEKRANVSGGERQRVVAARSFMRLQSGKVKFIAVDEPSSALDAEGELQLFNRLLEVRDGKTMIFVTHRFGHLTKHADTIICMKDGSIAEAGTHESLMKNAGEYAKLYNIQASAFESESSSKTTSVEKEP